MFVTGTERIDGALLDACPTLRAVIADVCRSWQPNLVQFEYTQTAALKDAAYLAANTFVA